MYAKTENRIRVECEYKLPKTNLHPVINNRSFPSSRNSSFVEALRCLMNNTPERMQPFQIARASFDDVQVLSASQAIEILAALSVAAGHNPRLLRQLLNFIDCQGKIRGGINADMDNLIAAAEKNGLLIKHRKRRDLPQVFTPCPAFKSLVTKLMN